MEQACKKPAKRPIDATAADSDSEEAMEQEQAAPPVVLASTSRPAAAEQEHPCNAPGCRLVFGSARELAVHFAAAHRFVCEECRAQRRGGPQQHAFASQAILDRHIEEHHDPFFQVLVERGERLYRCLADGCEASFGSGNARKLHCIAKHGFPHDFDFEGLLGAAAPTTTKRKERKPRLTEAERTARAEVIKASGAACRYYNTPGGCRRGDGCFFRHEKEAGESREVDALGEALGRGLRLEGVSFGRQGRGRSKRLERPPPRSRAQSGGGEEDEGGER